LFFDFSSLYLLVESYERAFSNRRSELNSTRVTELKLFFGALCAV